MPRVHAPRGIAARRTRRAVAAASGRDGKWCSACAAASRRRVAAAASVRNESRRGDNKTQNVAGWCLDARRKSLLESDLASSGPNVPESSWQARQHAHAQHARASVPEHFTHADQRMPRASTGACPNRRTYSSRRVRFTRKLYGTAPKPLARTSTAAGGHQVELAEHFDTTAPRTEGNLVWLLSQSPTQQKSSIFYGNSDATARKPG